MTLLTTRGSAISSLTVMRGFRLADHEFERYSYEPTFYNIIQTGRKLWVEIYIRNDTNMINVTQLAAIQKQLSSSLQDIYDDVYVEITPDIKEAAG